MDGSDSSKNEFPGQLQKGSMDILLWCMFHNPYPGVFKGYKDDPENISRGVYQNLAQEYKQVPLPFCLAFLKPIFISCAMWGKHIEW